MAVLTLFGQRLRVVRDKLLFTQHRRRTKAAWRQRHAIVFHRQPELARALPRELEDAHRAFWRPLTSDISMDTLRLCAALSGKAAPSIVPEELFASQVERCLGPVDWAPALSHKSLAPLLLRSAIFPDALAHGFSGEFFGSDGAPLTRVALAGLARGWNYPVVVKPNTDSAGGRDVAFPASADELLREIAGRRNFIVQQVMKQHPELDRFNRHGLNTVRVYTYRSVVNGTTAVLNAALRMGRGGSLDNETAGGIVVFVDPDGRLADVALDKYATRFEEHPDTHVVFRTASPLPEIQALWAAARDLASRLPLMRLAGWDFCFDRRGEWRCLEVNLGWHTIRFAQYAGQPFFGAFSEEVRDYCASHPNARRALWRVV